MPGPKLYCNGAKASCAPTASVSQRLDPASKYFYQCAYASFRFSSMTTR
jgi:hypothetical protein